MRTKLLLALPLAISPAFAGLTVLSDGDFQNANWSQSVVVQTDASPTNGVNGRVATGGNPDAYRQQTLTFSSGTGMIAVDNFSSALVYNPTSGALLSVSFSYDLASFQLDPLLHSTFPRYSPRILQDGKVYVLDSVEDGAARANWVSFQHTTAATDWVERNGTANPDFSASGSPIQFGYRVYLAANCACSINSLTLPSISGIDNLKISLKTLDDPGESVPEPSTFAALAAGLGTLVWARRKRRCCNWPRF